MEVSRVRYVLECVECGETATGSARGWHAYLFDADDDGENEVLCYCPHCAENEFGAA